MKRIFLVGLLLGALGVGIQAQNASTACPELGFLDVSTYTQTQNYPAPQLSIACAGDEIVITSNGIPNFEFRRITPSDLSAMNYTWRLPATPTFAEETTAIPLLGTVAIAVNGIPIYGPNEGGNLGYGDPYLDQILDFCNGHTAQQGNYHFHARPDCLFSNYENNTELVIAYALDGFPIYAPFVCEDTACTSVRKLNSSWVRTKDVTSAWEAHEYVEGAGDLDQCNGMVGADGTYRYYATDSFPYFLGCYVGEVTLTETTNGQGNGQPPQGGQGGRPPQGGQGGGQPPQGGQGGRPPQGGQGGGQPPQGGRPPQGGGS